MSPPDRPPRLPLRMAGGRPQPGYLRWSAPGAPSRAPPLPPPSPPPTDRIKDWIHGLEALSLEREEGLARWEEEEKRLASAAAQRGSGQGESARVGAKCHAPDDDNNNNNAVPNDPPAPKRSRLGNVCQCAISRMTGRRDDDNTTTKTESGPKTRIPRSPAFVGSIVAGNAVTTATGTSTTTTTPAATTTAPAPGPCDHLDRSLRFSAFSDAGSLFGATAGSAAGTSVPPRTLKVAIVGSAGAGKTAFFKRVGKGSFIPTYTSLVPDRQLVAVRLDDGSVVYVELWDLPGLMASDHAGPLLPTAFHAAIICFSLERVQNLAAISQVWKPKLDASHHNGDVYVLGLKSDVRPEVPVLQLNYLPTAAAVPRDLGEQACDLIQANGYGECSARTGANVDAVFQAIVQNTISELEARENAVGGGRGVERPRPGVFGSLGRCALRRLGRGSQQE
ncbi:eaeb0da2-67a2-4b5b-b081-def19e6626a8 [Thermothielavioides terrestris]|uniref:Eaeb0da2-67a2-4b5b-b081-def19e6626a8 n=1 Tax=Thermothielavioides terrestris TaxID=2587410 RepID=A0A446BD92_9PEZI|nr:eaeb0da2-67a2-4b5b-b081-def19e6626a8 [Thermothielavioides terrestris]